MIRLRPSGYDGHVRRLLLLFIGLLMMQGCAALRFELPEEFKSRKLKEDPPISLLGPAKPGQPQAQLRASSGA